MEIYKPYLRQLRYGEVALNVPYEDDAIQVNLIMLPDDPTSRLLVRPEGGLIRIMLEDGKDLQINDNLIEPARQRVPVLAEPVKELLLIESLDGEVWRTDGEGVEVIEPVAFEIFVGLVYSHTVQRQIERRRQPAHITI